MQGNNSLQRNNSLQEKLYINKKSGIFGDVSLSNYIENGSNYIKNQYIYIQFDTSQNIIDVWKFDDNGDKDPTNDWDRTWSPDCKIGELSMRYNESSPTYYNPYGLYHECITEVLPNGAAYALLKGSFGDVPLLNYTIEHYLYPDTPVMLINITYWFESPGNLTRLNYRAFGGFNPPAGEWNYQNRSGAMDISTTNIDDDDLESASRSGYVLRNNPSGLVAFRSSSSDRIQGILSNNSINCDYFSTNHLLNPLYDTIIDVCSIENSSSTRIFQNEMGPFSNLFFMYADATSNYTAINKMMDAVLSGNWIGFNPFSTLGIKIISPENRTYNYKKNIPLTFRVNGTPSWMGYSLDGAQNITISGNTTFNVPTYGVHNITVYLNDSYGSSFSDQVNFSVIYSSGKTYVDVNPFNIFQVGDYPVGSNHWIGDVNNDSLNDILIPHHLDGNVYVFLQTQSNAFSDSPNWTLTASFNVADIGIGDVNNDSLNDVVVRAMGKIHIYYQNQDNTLPINPNKSLNFGDEGRLFIGDFNSDGLNDILAGNWYTNQLRLYFQTQSNTFVDSPNKTFTSHREGVGDINNDGRLDIVGHDQDNHHIYIWYQSETGDFDENTPNQTLVGAYYFGGSWEVAQIDDFNNDNLNDIAIENSTREYYEGELIIFYQKEDGTFPNFPNFTLNRGYPGFIEFSHGDFNNDTLTDIVYSLDEELCIHYQRNNGTFDQTPDHIIYNSSYQFGIMSVGDINNDSLDDIVVNKHGGIRDIHLYLQREDISPPTFENLTESADPLGIGKNETISIDVLDNPGIGVSTVLIEYDSTNHTMINVGGNSWNWSNWKPSTLGIHNYRIFMADYFNNWNITTGNITVVNYGPIIENLTESADPLELGAMVTFNIDIYDVGTGVSKALIELEGINYTMNPVGGHTYEFNWTPDSAGLKNYRIYANDTEDEWNLITSSIQVNCTPHNLNLSADPIADIVETRYLIILNITNKYGYPVEGIIIEFELLTGMGYFSANTNISDEFGLVSVYFYPASNGKVVVSASNTSFGISYEFEFESTVVPKADIFIPPISPISNDLLIIIVIIIGLAVVSAISATLLFRRYRGSNGKEKLLKEEGSEEKIEQRGLQAEIGGIDPETVMMLHNLPVSITFINRNDYDEIFSLDMDLIEKLELLKEFSGLSHAERIILIKRIKGEVEI